MYLKLNGLYCTILLIYSTMSINLGRCASWGTQPSHNRGRDLSPMDSSSGWLRLPADTHRDPADVPQLEVVPHGPGREANGSAARPEHRLKRRTVSAFGEKYLYRPRPPSDRWVFSLYGPAQGNCSPGEIRRIVPGKFYIPGQLEASIPRVGFQSDSAAPAQGQRGEGRNRGQRVSSSEESWQKLQPVVECGDDAMTLTVRKRRAVQLLLDRANDSSVPVSQLSPHCGYSVVTSWRDLSLLAQYDACHVIQEDGSYVLPLLWRGAPVKMSCPIPPFQPQAVGPSSLCCTAFGMTVKIPGQHAYEEHLVSVRGEWTPLVQLAEQCGYTLDHQGAELAIAAPFIACGITEKDGKHTLTVAIANKVFTLACPVASSEETSIAHQAVPNRPSHSTSMTPTPVLSSLEPFQWLPPFYLAPPYYPHPTFQHLYAHPEGHSPANPSTTPILDMDPTATPQAHFHPLPDYRDYYTLPTSPNEPHVDLHFRGSLPTIEEEEHTSEDHLEKSQQRPKETPVLGFSEERRSPPTGFPAQLEAPHVQPPRHDFSPYYHYYHHPKIPLPGTPFQEMVIGTQLAKEHSKPEHDLQFPLLPSDDRDTEEVGKDDTFVSPIPKTSFHSYPFPAGSQHVNHAPALYGLYPQQSHPYQYYYYFPPIFKGEARKLNPSPSGKPLKTNLTDDQSHSHSAVTPPPNKGDGKTDLDEKSVDFTNYGEETSRRSSKGHEKLKEDMTPPDPRGFPPGTDPVEMYPELHPLFTPPQPLNYNSYHPYYGYSRAHYGPEGLLSAYKGMHPVNVKPSEPHLPISSFPANPPSPPTPLPVNKHDGAISPYYYYYYLYYQPDVSKGKQEVHPSNTMNRKKLDTSLSSKFKYDSMEMLLHKAPHPHVLYPMPNPFNSIYSQYTSRQHARHPVRPTSAGEKPQNGVMRETNAQTKAPSSSRCGFGSAPDLDCPNSDCCSHAIKGCALGQYFVFVVPYSMVGPTVVPTVHSSAGGNVSCTLQRLTSDLDIYIVPLDGCGVNKHMFGGMALHLLDLQAVRPYHGGSSLVRLTVGCSSSVGSPGEVMFHVMDQPSLPSAASVRLRLATDGTFTSFYPEAHLPSRLIQNGAVYVEVSVLDPPKPSTTLLVHSCLAYTQNVYASWMLVYDGCQNLSISQLLPSQKSHVQKIRISSFLPPPPDNSHPTAEDGYGSLEDPEIHFMCLTEVCSAAADGCSLGCIKVRVCRCPDKVLRECIGYLFSAPTNSVPVV